MVLRRLLLMLLRLRSSLVLLLLLLLLGLVQLLSLLPFLVLLRSLVDAFLVLSRPARIVLLLLLFVCVLVLVVVAFSFLLVVMLEQQLLHAIELTGLSGTRGLAEGARRRRGTIHGGLSLLHGRRWRQIRDRLRFSLLRSRRREIELSVAVGDGHVARGSLQRLFDLARSRRSSGGVLLVMVAHVCRSCGERVLSIDCPCSRLVRGCGFRGRLHLLFELAILLGLEAHAQDVRRALLADTQRLSAIRRSDAMRRGLVGSAQEQAAKHRLIGEG